MADTLFHKVWNAHTVRTLASGQTQLFIGLHLIHEVTSPQAFDMLRQNGWKVAYPERTVATIDHIVPTASQKRPFLDMMADMVLRLERLGYEGDYSFEVFNDDYQQLPLDTVAERARRSAIWLHERVLHRAAPLPAWSRTPR